MNLLLLFVFSINWDQMSGIIIKYPKRNLIENENEYVFDNMRINTGKRKKISQKSRKFASVHLKRN